MSAVRIYIPKKQASPNIDEALRYMGYGKNIPDVGVMEAVSECAEFLNREISCKCCYDIADLKFTDDGVIVGDINMKSIALSKNLSGCERAYIFAATIGIGADRLIRKYSAVSPARELIIDALASSAIENFCDTICDYFEAEGKLCLKPRFSPGYGDLDISVQTQLCRRLDTARKIGLSLTDSLLMLPSKSVTAISGIIR